MWWFPKTPVVLAPARQHALLVIGELEQKLAEEQAFWQTFMPSGGIRRRNPLSPVLPGMSHAHVWFAMKDAFANRCQKCTALFHRADGLLRTQKDREPLVAKLEVVFRDMTYHLEQLTRSLEEVESVPANPANWNRVTAIIVQNRAGLQDPDREDFLRQALAKHLWHSPISLGDFLAVVRIAERDGWLDQFLKKTSDGFAREAAAVARVSQSKVALQATALGFAAVIEELRQLE